MKIGKTSLFSGEEESFFLIGDPKQTGLSIMQRHVPDWPHLSAYLDAMDKAVEDEKFTYRNGVMDRVDLFYDYCYDWHKINKFGGLDPGDLPGWESSGAWKTISKAFHQVIIHFMAFPWSTRFICHTARREVEKRDGRKVDCLVPNLGKQADSAISGQVDVIACYKYDGGERVLVIEGSDEVMAGNKCDHNFMTPKGKRIREIPMGNSAEEAYANLLTAWTNQQPFTSLAQRDGRKERPAKKKRGRRRTRRKRT